MTPTPRSKAEAQIAGLLVGESTDGRPKRDAIARMATSTCFEMLRQPDKWIIEAGRKELAPALPKVPNRVQRDLVRVIWLAMIDEAAR